MTNWKLIDQVHVGTERHRIPVEKYYSTTSGLTVYLAQVPGPLVTGTMVIPTEARDHAGEPHCLEHLIFMGSEAYPFKGVLDHVANRSLAQGTNAWTDTDHTAYTVTTVGASGFLHVLPVFLDHVLFPLLRESAFATEVYHLVGETCADAGVVYAEMEARENTAESRGMLLCMRHLYGDPERCGYAAETGGLLRELRCLTNERIRAYHRDFYRPDNLALIVCGLMDRDLLFETLSRFEKRISDKFLGDGRRPWSEAVPPAPSQGVLVDRVVFPAEKVETNGADSDETGMVLIGWRGPSIDDVMTRVAIEVMNDYLSESGISPLQEALVELDDPYCNEVSFSQMDFRETANLLHIENVPIHRLEKVFDRVMMVLRRTYEQGIDVSGRLRTLIRRRRRQFYASLEDGANDSLVALLIPDFLYGDRYEDGKLDRALDIPGMLATLASQGESFWREDILRRWYLPSETNGQASLISCVICEPSKAEAQRLCEETARRMEERQRTLSVAQRVALDKRLADAVAENQVEAPEEWLPPGPGTAQVANIARFRVETLRIDDLCSGVRLQIDDVDSEFVRLTALLDARALSGRQRLLLPLLLETLFHTRVGERTHREVMNALLEDTVDYGCAVGIAQAGGGCSAGFASGPFSQSISVTIKAEREMYEACVHWLFDILYRSRFEKERVRVAAHKLLNDVAQHRRDGPSLLTSLSNEVLYADTDQSNCSAIAPLRQRKLLWRVLQALCDPNQSEEGADDVDDEEESMEPTSDHGLAESPPEAWLMSNPLSSAEELLEELDVLRRSLTSPGKVFLHAILHRDQELDTLLQPWRETFGVIGGMFPNGNGPTPAQPNLTQFSRETRPGVLVPRRSLVAGVDGIDSSFAELVADGPSSFQDADYPLYLVLFELLGALEGPLWHDIRGRGLAYGFDLHCLPESGTLSFSLYRSTAFGAALAAALGVIEEYRSRPHELIHARALESALSGVLCTLLTRESTVESAGMQRLLNNCRRVEGDFTGDLISQVLRIGSQELIGFASRALQAFVPEECFMAVVTNPARVAEALDSLQAVNASPVTCIESLDGFFALEKPEKTSLSES
jgi:Zn-dependent M16 (insulinase) family peptidase